MTTGSGARPDEREESQQRRERGGAAGEDVSKGIRTEDSGSPFGGSEEDTETQNSARDE